MGSLFTYVLYEYLYMRPILAAYAALTVVLHLEAAAFPMALLPFIPQNEIEIVDAP